MWVIGGWSDLCQLSGDCGGWGFVVVGGGVFVVHFQVLRSHQTLENFYLKIFTFENILHRNKQSNNSIYFH